VFSSLEHFDNADTPSKHSKQRVLLLPRARTHNQLFEARRGAICKGLMQKVNAPVVTDIGTLACSQASFAPKLRKGTPTPVVEALPPFGDASPRVWSWCPFHHHFPYHTVMFAHPFTKRHNGPYANHLWLCTLSGPFMYNFSTNGSSSHSSRIVSDARLAITFRHSLQLFILAISSCPAHNLR
jgi:hypothetical protein